MGSHRNEIARLEQLGELILVNRLRIESTFEPLQSLGEFREQPFDGALGMGRDVVAKETGQRATNIGDSGKAGLRDGQQVVTCSLLRHSGSLHTHPLSATLGTPQSFPASERPTPPLAF